MLNNWNREGKAPPIDWKTGDYHPALQAIQWAQVAFEQKIRDVSRYKDGEESIHNTLIYWNHLHLPWELDPGYGGPLPVMLANYQSSQWASSLGNLRSSEARRTEEEE